MIVEIKPSKACGRVVAPPSKSMAHRALICGAFSEKSIIRNVDFSKDITATIGCLEKLGANVRICGSTVTIGGLKLEEIPENCVLDCIESGSTLRFLLPICMASGKRITLRGSERLFARPLDVYEAIAKEQRIVFQKFANRYGNDTPSILNSFSKNSIILLRENGQFSSCIKSSSKKKIISSQDIGSRFVTYFS